MKMNVLHAAAARCERRISLEPRAIKVIFVVRLSVEQIQNVEVRAPALVELVRSSRIGSALDRRPKREAERLLLTQ